MNTSKRGPSRTFRLSQDLDARLQAAIAATGCNISELAQIVFTRSLENVTREILEQRASAAAEFLRASPARAPDAIAAPSPRPRKH